MASDTTTSAAGEELEMYTSPPEGERFSADTLAQQIMRNAPPEVHICCVVFFATFGYFGNALVLYIYCKQKTDHTGNVYIKCLAVLDLVALTLLLPQYPLLPVYVQDNTSWLLYEYFASFNAINLCYIWLLITMATDRLLAVYRPLRHADTRPKLMLAMLVLFLCDCSITAISWGEYIRYGTRVFAELANRVMILVYFTILSVSYSAMILKLYRQGRKMRAYISKGVKAPGGRSITTQHTGDVETAPDPHQAIPSISLCVPQPLEGASVTTSGRRASVPAQKINRSNHALHVTTVKTCLAVLLIFLISFLPILLVERRVFNNFFYSYLYFFNHTSNPVAYLLINKTFRQEIDQIFSKLC